MDRNDNRETCENADNQPVKNFHVLLRTLPDRVHDRDEKKIDHHARSAVTYERKRDADDRQEASGRPCVQEELYAKHHRCAKTNKFLKIFIGERADLQYLVYQKEKRSEDRQPADHPPFFNDRIENKIFGRLR